MTILIFVGSLLLAMAIGVPISFALLLSGVALVVVGLTYVPVLALGPIVESLS